MPKLCQFSIRGISERRERDYIIIDRILKKLVMFKKLFRPVREWLPSFSARDLNAADSPLIYTVHRGD
jgi:hypothetical protein